MTPPGLALGMYASTGLPDTYPLHQRKQPKRRVID
jgi:hypothetical protein